MRKVTENTVTAFLAGQKYAEGNTYTDGNTLYLHGNAIAWHDGQGDVVFTMAGWPSVTTRERLNGLFDMLGPAPFGISQRDHEQCFVWRGDAVLPVGTSTEYTFSDIMTETQKEWAK